MGTFLQDLRFALRMLLKSPGFTAAAVLSLGIGIGANATIYSLISAVFMQPLPIREAGRVVALYTADSKNRGGFNDFQPTSRPNFQDYRDRSTAFEGIAAYAGVGLNLSSGGRPEQVPGEIVSGSYFDVLGVTPALGRGFRPDEDRVDGARPVVILSDGLFRRRFGADPGLVGATIKIGGRPFTVVGVAPPGFHGLSALFRSEAWVPMAMHREVLSGFQEENFDDRRALLFNVVARLKPGATLERAREEVDRIGRQLEGEYPVPNRFRTATLLPIVQTLINPNIRRAFLLAGGLLMTVVALVLLIACANVANLLLARATARRREIAVRMSLGAGRWRLVRQLLTESLVLGILGGAAGLLLAFWGKDLLLVWRPPAFLPPFLDLRIDAGVLTFTLLVSVATGLLFGLAPALQATRSDLSVELKDRTASGRRARLGSALVVGQVALSLLALIGAGLFLRSLRNMQSVDPGFESRRLLILGFDLGAQGYDQARALEFDRRALERARSLPGVQGAALSDSLPIAGGAIGRTVFPEGRAEDESSTGTFVNAITVTPEYFDTASVAVLEGRGLEERDDAQAPPAVVINQAMARRFWPDQDPIGKRFKFFGDERFREVVGLAENTKLFLLAEDPQPIAYVPLRQMYTPQLFLYVRTGGDPSGLLETVRRAIQALDPDLPLTNVQTVGALLDQSLWAARMGAGLLSLFGLLALFLAAVGLYGVLSYSVTRRTREFGIRMALGADRRDVLALVLRQGMLLVLAGLAVGLAGALVSTHLVGSLLFGVSATDPPVFLLISAVLLGVALVAGYLPARRATRVDPLVALRYE